MTNPIHGQPPITPQKSNPAPIATSHSWSLSNEHITALSQKIAPFCTSDFLSRKVKSWMYAKIAPLSTPEELIKAKNKAKKDLSRLAKIRSETSEHLTATKNYIQFLSSKNPSSAKLPPLKRLESHYEQRIDGLAEAITITKQYIAHLETKQKATISSRVTGYVGAAANLLIPGVGPSVNFALTTTAAALPVISAAKLKDTKEQRNVRWSTAITALSFIASTALYYYVWPTVNAYATAYFAQSQNNQS